MNIYVGNLSYKVTEGELQTLFGEQGKVISAKIMKDKYCGDSQGFGFVDMEKQSEVEQVVKQLHGHALAGRTLTVNAVHPHNDRSRSKQGQ